MISIGYFTNRTKPLWEHFCDSLANQVPADMRDKIEVVFVDHKLWSPVAGCSNVQGYLSVESLHDAHRTQKLDMIVAGRFKFIHVPPMPCVWQGPFRQTKTDYFAASNARNTFLAIAQHPYLVHVDDLSVLLPGWFDQVRHAAEGGYCVCGAYKKVKNLVVKDGNIMSCTEFEAGVDSRWERGSDTGIVPWTGAAMYGCSFAVPLDLMLKVNGSDLFCDSQGAEDYDLGIRLHRAGGRFFYNRNMTTFESEEDHFTEEPFKRISKLVTSGNLPAKYEGSRMSDHVMLNRVNREDRITTLSQHNMLAIREEYQKNRRFAIPAPNAVDWRDGVPLAEM